MNETLFTKIINGTIPSHKLYEDEYTYAFLDIHPVTTGHTLVVPKTPAEFVWDLTSDDYQALMSSVQKIARHLRKTLDVPYIGQQILGVDVPHAHVHLIPFRTADEYYVRPDMTTEPDHQQLAALAEMLRLS